jgi:hypothetical protein
MIRASVVSVMGSDDALTIAHAYLETTRPMRPTSAGFSATRRTCAGRAVPLSR